MVQQEGALDHEWIAYKRAALAPNTQTAYAIHVRTYMTFCNAFGYTPVPATPVTMCRYAAYLARTHASSSVRCYMAGIRHMHLELGYPSPTDEYHIGTVLKGIDTTKGKIPSKKLPITLDILQAVYKCLDLGDDFQLCFWAACLVGFFTFARKASLLTRTLTSHCCRRDLCRRDFEFDGSNATIRFKHNKTIQDFTRVLVVPIPVIEQSPLCPVTALLKSLVRTRQPAAAPLLSYRLGENTVPLTHHAFTSTLSAMLNTAGYSPSKYSGHSLRRGGATFALSCGLPTEVIKAQGDWKSNAYERYTDVSLQLRNKCVKVLGDNVLGQFKAD